MNIWTKILNIWNFREKKKEKLQSLLHSAEQLEKSNTSLRQECYRLEAEKRYLVKMLMDRTQNAEQENTDSFANTISSTTTQAQSEEQILLDNLDFNLQFWVTFDHFIINTALRWYVTKDNNNHNHLINKHHLIFFLFSGFSLIADIAIRSCAMWYVDMIRTCTRRWVG